MPVIGGWAGNLPQDIQAITGQTHGLIAMFFAGNEHALIGGLAHAQTKGIG